MKAFCKTTANQAFESCHTLGQRWRTNPLTIADLQGGRSKGDPVEGFGVATKLVDTRPYRVQGCKVINSAWLLAF